MCESPPTITTTINTRPQLLLDVANEVSQALAVLEEIVDREMTESDVRAQLMVAQHAGLGHVGRYKLKLWS